MDFQTINLLYRCSREYSHEKIRMQDLSDTECMICSYIYSHADCSQDDVATALRADKTTVAKALAALEARNCVERTQDAADRRRKNLRLTEEGSAKIAGLVDLHNQWLAEILTCLTDEEQKTFERCCERLLAAAEQFIAKREEDK